ncbi:hypothetical protein GVAV_000164 [Gurleya vavrai]
MTSQNLRFRDLPQNTKQKLIDLHNKSKTKQISQPVAVKIENYNDINAKIDSLQSDAICRNLKRVGKFLDERKDEIDAEILEEKVIVAIENLEKRVKAYNKAIECPFFLDELKLCYMKLTGKYLSLKNNKK